MCKGNKNLTLHKHKLQKTRQSITRSAKTVPNPHYATTLSIFENVFGNVFGNNHLSPTHKTKLVFRIRIRVGLNEKLAV